MNDGVSLEPFECWNSAAAVDDDCDEWINVFAQRAKRMKHCWNLDVKNYVHASNNWLMDSINELLVNLPDNRRLIFRFNFNFHLATTHLEMGADQRKTKQTKLGAKSQYAMRIVMPWLIRTRKVQCDIGNGIPNTISTIPCCWRLVRVWNVLIIFSLHTWHGYNAFSTLSIHKLSMPLMSEKKEHEQK